MRLPAGARYALTLECSTRERRLIVRNGHLFQTGILLGSLVMTMGACTREATAPELQTTRGEQARMQPVTVTGCLKGGLAENTYVLMASQASGAATDTATYQLTARDEVNLRQYVGQKVEVAGTLRAEQEVASNGVASEQKPAKGTSGTPTVDTKTELDVKRLDVTRITPAGGSCDQ
jgi:hypothetical protein